MPQPFTEQIQATGMMLIQILSISKYRLSCFMMVVSSMNDGHATRFNLSICTEHKICCLGQSCDKPRPFSEENPGS